MTTKYHVKLREKFPTVVENFAKRFGIPDNVKHTCLYAQWVQTELVQNRRLCLWENSHDHKR